MTNPISSLFQMDFDHFENVFYLIDEDHGFLRFKEFLEEIFIMNLSLERGEKVHKDYSHYYFTEFSQRFLINLTRCNSFTELIKFLQNELDKENEVMEDYKKHYINIKNSLSILLKHISLNL